MHWASVERDHRAGLGGHRDTAYETEGLWAERAGVGGQVFVYLYRCRRDAQIHRIILVCKVSPSELRLTLSADSWERSVQGEVQGAGLGGYWDSGKGDGSKVQQPWGNMTSEAA